MKTSQQLSAELAQLCAEVAPMLKRIDLLQTAFHKAASKEFIEANGITRADVESSDGHECFGTIWKFADWCKAHSTKNWAEWNTIIYRMSDITNGRMPPDMPARTGDL